MHKTPAGRRDHRRWKEKAITDIWENSSLLMKPSNTIIVSLISILCGQRSITRGTSGPFSLAKENILDLFYKHPSLK
jgi:hypothetical protein